MINSIPDDVLMLFYAEKITPDLWGNDAVYRIGDVEVAGWLFDKYIIEFIGPPLFSGSVNNSHTLLLGVIRGIYYDNFI